MVSYNYFKNDNFDTNLTLIKVCVKSPQEKLVTYKTSAKGRLKLRTVELVKNNHHWDPKIVALVDRWSLFREFFVV